MTRTVLVLGGGTAGNALTVLLRRAGHAVDLVEAKPDWNATAGSGITLQGNALRVLREVGVLDEVLREGFPFDELGLLAPTGAVVAVQPTARIGGADLPGTLGMQRPRLQRILIDAVRASGASVRLGLTATALDQDDDGVDVTFSDGSTGRYDLVVGADGLNSATRGLIGVEDRPVPTGMAIWRAPVPRPTGLEHTRMIYGGTCFIAGCCPTGPDTAYAYLVERNRDRDAVDPAGYAEEMRRLAQAYGGPWPEIRAALTDPAVVNYTWFDRLLVEGPWHRGRVVLVGDAAHACPPTLAQGAAMSLEDALVLAELSTRDTWDDALLTEYRDRRYPRVREVVDASVQLGQWLLDGVRDADVPGLMGRTMAMLAARP
ncbi:2-polyprenyl-6-methoxyphenol hydroxylase-like FAD-dependent oxidoreductase [Saccharothrix carnea]|uniref:2-polyprenyl-6-methoxyphenol hydroxylase-like FAD-dependent oxidoreductase n=1 Tax=Saccharothrix carnea TaxID=1280637 RepID=A0A2P8I0D6_SACCR|nr:FAD-dependent oxidoreductase [Saccharothrix carnea]PSL51938.1 2-polyprenyl-6-methoxyphenol hydroxylase-like FAD-dependent oxidoreductase [Saccharothrix carnea]